MPNTRVSSLRNPRGVPIARCRMCCTIASSLDKGRCPTTIRIYHCELHNISISSISIIVFLILIKINFLKSYKNKLQLLKKQYKNVSPTKNRTLVPKVRAYSLIHYTKIVLYFKIVFMHFNHHFKHFNIQ